MKRFLGFIAAALALYATPVQAQHQPYASLKDRPIKGLSTEEIASLRAGRGMSMALPAELNRYPGPIHVLENAGALGLTSGQREMVGRQFDAMRNDAIALGERIIDREAALDALFRSGSADAGSIDSTTAEIAALYGQLRAVHLRTHLATRAMLTDAQRTLYETLRGYDVGGATPIHKH